MGKLGDHPNIVTVFDIGDDNGQPYIVSQYMGGGGDLDGLLNRAPDRRLVLRACAPYGCSKGSRTLTIIAAT